MFLFLSLFLLVSGYTWPNPQIDMLEAILYQQNGYRQLGLSSAVVPCNSDINALQTGRTDSAEWYRNAYHDMSTHDVDTGLGGLDASIGFETHRPENAGKAFNESLGFFNAFHSARSSMSDLVALGALFSVSSCSNGQVNIPYRVGRVDAAGPGPSGVPQPQESLATHTEKFRKQGFNQTEMIALVACGHTLGGVHGVDFPDIVPVVNNPDNQESRVNFDGTVAAFDNSVATQFIANTTQNPLAFGKNVTTRSDHRIFTSDGSKMITAMAKSNAFYLGTCKTLLERMLNTVPRAVTLSDVVQPTKIRPNNIEIDVNASGGSITFSGEVRIIENAGFGSLSAKRKVSVTPILRSTGKPATTSTTATTSTNMGASALYPNMPSFQSYAWSTTLPTSQGVSGFELVVNGVKVVNGDGRPFPVQDAVVVQRAGSCTSLGFVGSGTNSTINLTVAVRDSAALSFIKLTVPVPTTQPGSIVAKFVSKSINLVKKSPIGKSGYTSYTTSFSFTFGDIPPLMSYDVQGLDASGKVVVQDLFRRWDDLNRC